ncbi:hypothetical protein A3B87_01480 [Candidatus Kuenenbacteria bacterium RIFCSPHIGHO2_02_FULL_39_13]|uniref:Uncharacterized protein n=1 Tax=Candidatus Kuenenbacteria bacterium RIFCSPHIGHO2_02_FULL_39_13 TaxID=1798561 RepID=A0A1F6FNT2_9BACT|nr:MAG: hypothetical protein A3B87_01480 [Candidatus Kuenenbacteria bacterium RIFCSPHIGHO2_02_FULL_39_13]
MENLIGNIPAGELAVILFALAVINYLAMRRAFKLWMLQEEQKKRIKSDSFVPGNINTLKKEMK